MRRDTKQDKKRKRRRVRNTSDDSWKTHKAHLVVRYRGRVYEPIGSVVMSQQVAIEYFIEYGGVDGYNEWTENGLCPFGFDCARGVQHDQRMCGC